ncbi:glycosyltransferase [Candidatus Gottesmanbacteria bacterium]|nr:glycosyltransferase [Candidatus Gottesmanbacteria bacterium]
MNSKGVSIIIPAFDEEKNIQSAIKSADKAVRGICSKYEILVVNDGSMDRTGQKAELETKSNKSVRVINLTHHKGYGEAIKKGIEEAKMDYLTVFPGDNDMDSKSLAELIKNRGLADLIISYLGKSDTRRLMRRIASLTYIALVSTLFQLKLEYYNGSFICRTKLLKKLRLISTGFTICAEVKIRLIKRGYSYKEIPFIHTGRLHGKSKALTFRSIANALIVTLLLRKDIKS